MVLFPALFIKILPLYFVIALGYAAGRVFEVDGRHMALFTINAVAPVVFLGLIWPMEIDMAVISLPFLFFAMICIMAGLTWLVASRIWSDGTQSLAAFSASIGNTGYFGLPILLAAINPALAGLYVFTNIAAVFFQSGVGYYILARGKKFSPRESMARVLRLPPFIASLLAVALNVSGLPMPEWFGALAQDFKGAYVVLGMAIIGLALSRMKVLEIDWRFILVTSVMKFGVWPLLVFGGIWLDKSILHVFNADVYTIFILFSLMPVGANTAAYASQLHLHPEKAGAAVLVTTLFALFFIPAVYAVMGF